MPELPPRAGIMAPLNVANANAVMVSHFTYISVTTVIILLDSIDSAGLTIADRMYDPRPYDTRYNPRWDDRDRDRDRDRYRGDRYDESRHGGGRYEDRRPRYDDRRS